MGLFAALQLVGVWIAQIMTSSLNQSGGFPVFFAIIAAMSSVSAIQIAVNQKIQIGQWSLWWVSMLPVVMLAQDWIRTGIPAAQITAIFMLALGGFLITLFTETEP